MLFAGHLAYTGMHVVDLFYRAVTAYLCQQCGSAGTGDATQIAVIANMGQGAKDRCKAEAINIYNYIVTKNDFGFVPALGRQRQEIVIRRQQGN
ncbi:hypothetical protein ACFX2C_021611 [Malus domestica]